MTSLAAQFAADVRYYLQQAPRQLPSRYLYDALGSALFDAICELPWYPLARAERRLIARHGHEIMTKGGRVPIVLELGPGNGDKLAMLIDAGGPHDDELELHLVDVSASALAQATRRLDRFAGVRIRGHQMNYEAGLAEFAAARSGPGSVLVLLLGSNIGNFDPPGRAAFLDTIRRALVPGDRLLLGVDLVKPEPELLLAYDDPLGVTAAFNRNLLVRANRELGADFDLDAYAHRAVWNEAHSRVEMHLVSRRPNTVRIPAADLELAFAEGDWIWTESSYKFTVKEVEAVVSRSGFRITGQWTDDVDRFTLTLAEAV